MKETDVPRFSVEDYARMIVDRLPFALANYGDGEWSCILGRSGANVNGEVYCRELAEALRKTLLEPVGQWCGTNSGKRLRSDVERWIAKNEPPVSWVWKETLSAANVHGKLGPFFRAARQRRPILVGPRHLSTLSLEVVDHRAFIVVPDAVAWKSADRIVNAIAAIAEEDSLVLLAAGMATNLIVHRLWPEFSSSTLVDIGAIFDPYAGLWTRKKYRERIFQEKRMKENLL